MVWREQCGFASPGAWNDPDMLDGGGWTCHFCPIALWQQQPWACGHAAMLWREHCWSTLQQSLEVPCISSLVLCLAQ